MSWPKRVRGGTGTRQNEPKETKPRAALPTRRDKRFLGFLGPHPSPSPRDPSAVRCVAARPRVVDPEELCIPTACRSQVPVQSRYRLTQLSAFFTAYNGRLSRISRGAGGGDVHRENLNWGNVTTVLFIGKSHGSLDDFADYQMKKYAAAGSQSLQISRTDVLFDFWTLKRRPRREESSGVTWANSRQLALCRGRWAQPSPKPVAWRSAVYDAAVGLFAMDAFLPRERIAHALGHPWNKAPTNLVRQRAAKPIGPFRPVAGLPFE